MLVVQRNRFVKSCPRTRERFPPRCFNMLSLRPSDFEESTPNRRMRRTGTKPTSFFVNGWAIAHRGTVCRFSSLQLEHKKALLEKIGKELKILDV